MEKKNKIIGFDLLRIWLSFEVVFDHYWRVCGDDPVTNFLLWMCGMAVPCFMMMSFYLTGSRFETGDAPWLKNRLVRLLTPYLFWPAVFYLVMLLGSRYSTVYVETLDKLSAFWAYKTPIEAPVTDLLWQWFLGSSRRNSMQFWFHADLLILTVSFFALFRFVAARWRTHLVVALIAAALVFQYSGLNLRCFENLPFESRYTLGRVAPMLVLASVGFLFGRLRGRLANLALADRWFFSLAGLALFFFVYLAKPFVTKVPGFSYQGLANVFAAMGLVAFFHFLPLERLPELVQKVLGLCARYCMGIYCVHFGLAWLLYSFVFPHLGIGRETLVSNLVIWAFSWILCHLVAQIPGKFTKNLVQ